MENLKYSDVLIVKLTIVVLVTLSFFLSCKHTTKVDGSTTKQIPAVNTDTSDSFDAAVSSLMEKHNVPGVSIGLIRNGKVQTKSFGILQSGSDIKIDENTVFSVGSVSKVVNALVVLKLVSDGKLDLDEDVDKYLKNWKVPRNDFSEPVTLRRILSHTAGLSVHGFADYYPGESLPTPIQTLKGERPAKSGKVQVTLKPGSRFRYSGGGTTVSQQVVEDVTGMSYVDATNKILLEPLGIKRATFENPIPAKFGNIAKAHNGSGKAVALPRGYQAMPEMAASGLWITPGELLTVLSGIENKGFIKREIIKDMITSEENTEYGLGPRIRKHTRGTVVSHGGSNESYKAEFQILWEEKTGFAVFTNSASGARLIRDLEPTIKKALGF